jgi:hypothetical protein
MSSAAGQGQASSVGALTTTLVNAIVNVTIHVVKRLNEKECLEMVIRDVPKCGQYGSLVALSLLFHRQNSCDPSRKIVR